jgi:hypothetical protein
MRRTRISIYRPDGTLYAQHIWCEVTQASDQEVWAHQQAWDAHGSDIMKIDTDFNPIYHLMNKDLLIDEAYADPVTGQPMQYRVVGRVKVYEDHDAAYCEVYRGN